MTPQTPPAPKPRRRWLRWLLGIPLLFICIIVAAFSFLPAPEDTPIPLDQQGGGARQKAEAVTGLQAAWPDIPAVDPRQAALGKRSVVAARFAISLVDPGP